jgi:hypothetical protein
LIGWVACFASQSVPLGQMRHFTRIAFGSLPVTFRCGSILLVQLDPDIEPTTRRSLSLVLTGFEIRPPMNGGMAQLLVGPEGYFGISISNRTSILGGMFVPPVDTPWGRDHDARQP